MDSPANNFSDDFAVTLYQVLIADPGPGVSVEKAAAALDMNKWSLYKAAQGKLSFHAHLILPLYQATRDIRILRAIMPENVYLTVLSIPEKSPSLDAMRQAALVARECAEAISAHLEAWADMRLTGIEHSRVDREINEAIEALLWLKKFNSLMAPRADRQLRLAAV